MAQIFHILRFLERTGDRQFLLLLLDVVAVVISDGYVFTLLLHLSGICRKLISDCLFRYEFIRWLLDCVLCRQHVAYRLVRLD